MDIEDTQLPRPVFDREVGQIFLREFFQKDDDGNYLNFDANQDRNNSNMKYRTPIHQRYNKWASDAKRDLIESIYMNYATPSIILSRHSDGEMNFYFNIEDGQSRFTVIQEYLDDKFKFNGKLFSERTINEQNRFLDYCFPTSITIPHRTRADNTTIDDHHFENFDRINRGKPLTDNDKYWCKKDKPLVQLAIQLIELCKTEYPFMKTSKFNTMDSKGRIERKPLEEFVTILGALFNNIYKKTYSRHFLTIGAPVTTEQRVLLTDFMTFYKSIHDTMFEIMPKRGKEHIPKFNNPGQFLGMIIMDFKDNTTDIDQKKTMWVDILNIDRCSHNFMKCKNTLFNDFTDGDKKNQEQENIRRRLSRVREFYNDKNHVSTHYHIEYEENDTE